MRTRNAGSSNSTMPCSVPLVTQSATCARSFFLALTHAKFSRVPLNTPTRRYYQNINRYSAAFALAIGLRHADARRRIEKASELLSARLGDVLSSMYLASCVLKHFENQGRRATDLAAGRMVGTYADVSCTGSSCTAFLRNFPNRPVAWSCCACSFSRAAAPTQHPPMTLGHKVVDLISTPGEARERLSEFRLHRQ